MVRQLAAPGSIAVSSRRRRWNPGDTTTRPIEPATTGLPRAGRSPGRPTAGFFTTEHRPTPPAIHGPRRRRLARRFGQGPKGYVYWDPMAIGPDPARPGQTIRGRWVGLDVPDFPATKPPTAPAQIGQTRAGLPRRSISFHHEGGRQGMALRSFGVGRWAAAGAL